MDRQGPPNQGRRRARPKPARLDPSWIAIQGLRFLAGDREAADRFFALTGLDAGTIRSAAEEPGFASVLLDYLVESEALLEQFAAQAGCHPADVASMAEQLKARDNFAGEDP